MSAVRDRAFTPAGLLAPGTRLGRYEVLTKLATGGMAVVYVASAQGAAGFERLFAVKVLHANLAHEEEFISMFLDEARLAARIRHPNVVATIDISDTAETGYYLVMEYVEGDHLGGLLSGAHKAGERLSVPVVLRVMIDALAGLGAAHELRDDAGQRLNIVHRDVSPHNILVGSDGIARLTDFGVAKAEGRLTHTRDGQVKGKLAYMAPEQASSGATDSRSDLFSAGIILWECVTGRRLFRAENSGATLMKLLSEPIAAPSAIEPALAPLDPVLKKALDRDPTARFQTAEEFIEGLEWVAGRLGGIAPPRAVTKAVRQYAADKLARERKMIEAAQRAVRVGNAELFPEGAEPSAPSLSSEVSLWSASMSRSKPSGVFSAATAPRLFTRNRSPRPTPSETSAQAKLALPLPPPPLGELSSLGVPPVPELVFEPTPPRTRLLLAFLVACTLVAGLGAWLAFGAPAREPKVRAVPLAPSTPTETVSPIALPDGVTGSEPQTDPGAAQAGVRSDDGTAAAAAPGASGAQPAAAANERAGGAKSGVAKPTRAAGGSRTRTRRAPATGGQPSAPTQPATDLLPNPYTQ